MFRMRTVFVALAAVAAMGLVGCSKARGPADVDGARIQAADKEPGNWMSNGRTYDEQRFSPLTKINDTNAGQLGLAWSYDLDTNRGQEATPIVVDGVMYVSTAWSKVKAFDAATGALLWAYDPQVPGEWGWKACCDVVNRGVAVWKGRVYVGTIDGRLVALDAKTGKPVFDVSTIDKTKSMSITGAPRIIKGLVLIGMAGGEYGVRGFISAYDAQTGALKWRFYTVPGDPSKPFENKAMEMAAKTWRGEWWKWGGGGTVWDAIVYDPALDLIYFGTDNGDPWNKKLRSPGVSDDLFLTSILAVKADTGEYVWHFQVNPGDEWDYSAVQPMILADISIGGAPRKVLMQAPKNGFFYVLDRTNGKLISAKAITPMNWATGIDANGRPIENPQSRYTLTGKPFWGTPGPAGAHAWNPMAFSPKTGLVYIPVQETIFPYVPFKDFEKKPMGFNIGVDLAGDAGAPDIKAIGTAGNKGYLLAWNPATQTQAWRVDLPGPANGGVLATAGNLVVQGDVIGNFAAYRADSGAKLWSMPVQGAVMAAPVTYEVKGDQYIAVLSGFGGATGLSAPDNGMGIRNVSRVLVFKLGGAAKLSERPVVAKTLAPPPLTATPQDIAAGSELYGRYCAVCHAAGAASTGIVPDLRYSDALKDDSFFDIVLGGALKANGMASWSAVLDKPHAELIRGYLISRAHDRQAELAKAAK